MSRFFPPSLRYFLNFVIQGSQKDILRKWREAIYQSLPSLMVGAVPCCQESPRWWPILRSWPKRGGATQSITIPPKSSQKRIKWFYGNWNFSFTFSSSPLLSDYKWPTSLPARFCAFPCRFSSQSDAEYVKETARLFGQIQKENQPLSFLVIFNTIYWGEYVSLSW